LTTEFGAVPSLSAPTSDLEAVTALVLLKLFCSGRRHKIADFLLVMIEAQYLCAMFIRTRERHNGKVTILIVENIREKGQGKTENLAQCGYGSTGG
jgi:hypothetical protein